MQQIPVDLHMAVSFLWAAQSFSRKCKSLVLLIYLPDSTLYDFLIRPGEGSLRSFDGVVRGYMSGKMC